MSQLPHEDKVYEFCGTGLGIPGLPHKITEREAKALNVLDLLNAAIKSGVYREIRRPAVIKNLEVKNG